MTKRSRPDSSDGEWPSDRRGQAEPSSSGKRSKKAVQDSAEAIGLLLEHSDSLVACLASLRDSGSHVSPAQVNQLSSMSKALLPAFKFLRHYKAGATPESAGVHGTPQQTQADATPSLAPGEKVSRLPPVGNLTAWLPSDIPQNFPPLPAIRDPKLERAAFTHEGEKERLHDVSYERLEFVGDAFIYHVASEYIAQTFPDHTPGQCTLIRERLLRNSTLAEYSIQYGFDKRGVFPSEFSMDGRVGGTKAGVKERQKVLGDLFEAYVGALIRSDGQGVARALNWLKPLWGMSIAEDIHNEYRHREKEHELPAKVQLARLIGCPGVKIRYEDLPSKSKVDKNNRLKLFAVAVHVDGWGKSEQLGFGSAPSKKDAGAKAAKQAMANKSALKLYVEKRTAYFATQKAQAEEDIF